MTRKRQRPIDDGIEFSSKTPTETRATKEISQTTEVKIPRSQAFWVALPVAVAFIVTVVAPVAMGDRVFYGVAGLAALAAFLWSVQFEVKWQDRVTLPLLVGFVGWCFRRFAEWQRWGVPDAWQPAAALVALGSVVFWWLFSLALWLTFVQRLGLPMFHQQFFLWKAVNTILEARYKDSPEPDTEAPPARDVTFTVITNNGHERRHITPPVSDEVFQAVANVLLDGKSYCEENLCGTDKPLNGGKKGRRMLDELRDWMIEQGILMWKRRDARGDPVRRQGVSLTSLGEQWLDEALPHPTDETFVAGETDDRTDERTNE